MRQENKIPGVCFTKSSDGSFVRLIIYNDLADFSVNPVEQYKKRIIKVSQSLQVDRSSCEIVSVMPILVPGRLKKFLGKTLSSKMGLGTDRMVLLIVVQKPNETGVHKKVIDPREGGLNVQGFFDRLNPSRYVAALTTQATMLSLNGIEVTSANLKASLAVQRASHFDKIHSLKKTLKIVGYVPPISKDNPTPGEVIKHHLARIRYLQKEYDARKETDHEFHGFTIFDRYSTASFFTRKIASKLKLAFSATEKLNALNEVFSDDKGVSAVPQIDFFRLPSAARQGELGKSLRAIARAQSQLGIRS